MIRFIKIFSIVLILFFMAEPTWGLLSKSAVDAETVEGAVTRLIAVHEADETSHLDTGESLQSHKAAAIIDHIAGSIIEDKIGTGEISSRAITTDQIVGKDIRTATNVGSGTSGVKMTSTGIEMWDGTVKKVSIPTSGDPIFQGTIRAKELQFLRNFWYTNFQTLDNWTVAGTGSTYLGVGPFVIASGATANNIKSIYAGDYTGDYINTTSNDVSFETCVRFHNLTNTEYVFGINMQEGVPNTDGTYANGVSFEVKTSKLYAVKYKNDVTRVATEIAGATLTGFHRYRVDIVHAVSIKYYVDEVLVKTETTELPDIIPYVNFGYSVKTLTAAARYIDIIYLSLETPF
jgi:hypothetical protein